jgi:cytochrome c biogenesis protein CcdA
VQQDLVGLAFAAGLVAALNPCGFAMLPAYLTLVVRGNTADGAAASVGRAIAATAAMTLGFLTVFAAFGLLTVSLASAVQRYMPYVTIVIGIALVTVGLLLLAGREPSLAQTNRLARSVFRAPTRSVGSMFGYGVGYAVASLSCTVGPFLSVTGAGIGGTSAVERMWIYVAYASGFALIVGALAVTVALASTALVDRMRRILPYVSRFGGVVLIIVGLYVGYYGYYEVRLFNAGGSPTDPVIAAAGRLQGAIAGWVHQHGAWPWAVLLAALTASVVTLAWFSRRFRAGRATGGDEPSPAWRGSPRPGR